MTDGPRATGSSERIAMMTREYPPEVYGGAGVHVTELVAHLRALCDVDVHCMGTPREGVFVHRPDPALAGANPALTTLSTDLVMAQAAERASLAHSHTWYTAMAGHLAKLLHGIPHVMTTHSLEPRRPWKAEQLGGGYLVSSWVEHSAIHAADAVIAVSSGMREDIMQTYPDLDPARIHVVRNGIDTTTWYPVDPAEAAARRGSVLTELGLDLSRPIVAFVGRITRQKGLAHLVAAAHGFAAGVQLVLCAGEPDTPEIAEQITAAVTELSAHRPDVHWIRGFLPAPSIREILSAATVFVCPSIYEPLGIVNLEAMACGTAVVASRVGGIPEVVTAGVTGTLVDYASSEATAFETGLTDAVNELIADPAKAARFGAAGRARCIENFSWAHIAALTMQVYQQVLTR